MKWVLWEKNQKTDRAVSPEKNILAGSSACFADICLLSCVDDNQKKVLSLTYLEGSKAGVKKVHDQLTGYLKTTLSAKFINDERIIPGAGSYRQQLPQYFYDVKMKTISQGVVFDITGTEEALKEAVNALVVGGFCEKNDFPPELIKQVNVEDSRTMSSQVF